MRREKELAESRFEVAQGESLRYRLRMEHLERELKEVQDSLSAARERMQVSHLSRDPQITVFENKIEKIYCSYDLKATTKTD